MDDESDLDYTADWNTFSFEAELEMRKNIHEEDLKAYNKFLNETSDVSTGEIIINELKNKEEEIEKLVNTNKNMISKYNSLLEEQKTIKDNLKKLAAKNDSLLKTIDNLEKEKITSEKSFEQLNLALQKASEMYTTCFNINISTKPLSDATYEAFLYFKDNNDIPIKFVIDRIKKKVLDFQPNGALSPKEENDIRNEFKNFENIHGLFCALHDIISKK